MSQITGTSPRVSPRSRGKHRTEMSPMTLTGTWIKTPAGTLVLKWTPGQAPVRHLHKPYAPGISETRAA